MRALACRRVCALPTSRVMNGVLPVWCNEGCHVPLPLCHTRLHEPPHTQVTIAGGVGHPHIKKLAYDLCRAVPLLDADYGLLQDGIKVSSVPPQLSLHQRRCGQRRKCCVQKLLLLHRDGGPDSAIAPCVVAFSGSPSDTICTSAQNPHSPANRATLHRGRRSCKCRRCPSCLTCHPTCWWTWWTRVRSSGHQYCQCTHTYALVDAVMDVPSLAWHVRGIQICSGLDISTTQGLWQDWWSHRRAT